jgi:hypothetical protein
MKRGRKRGRGERKGKGKNGNGRGREHERGKGIIERKKEGHGVGEEDGIMTEGEILNRGRSRGQR